MNQRRDEFSHQALMKQQHKPQDFLQRCWSEPLWQMKLQFLVKNQNKTGWHEPWQQASDLRVKWGQPVHGWVKNEFSDSAHGFRQVCAPHSIISPGVVTTAPIGNPLPMPFAIVTISGITSWPWKPQKWLPVRPNPVCTCEVKNRWSLFAFNKEVKVCQSVSLI